MSCHYQGSLHEKEREQIKIRLANVQRKFKLEVSSLTRFCFDINPCLQLSCHWLLQELWSHSCPRLPSCSKPRRWVSLNKANNMPLEMKNHSQKTPTAQVSGKLNIDQAWCAPSQWNTFFRFPSGIFYKNQLFAHRDFNRFPFSDGKEFPWNTVSGILLLHTAHMLRKQKQHLQQLSQSLLSQQLSHPALHCCWAL